MGKKESNIRPENAVKPEYPSVGPGSRYGGVWVPDLPEDPTEVKLPYQEKCVSPPAAVRDDGGKLKWHLLPVPALLGLVKVFHGGALKYAENQWRGGMKWSRIYRSMISHFLKWLATDNSYDKELGTHHLMMVAWGCFVLYMYEVVYKFTDYDDRPEKGLLTDEDFEFIMGMLTTEKALTDKQMQELEDQWKNKYSKYTV